MSDGDPSAHEMVTLDLRYPIWERVFTVAPRVVVGTREGDGFDLAPKHLVLECELERVLDGFGQGSLVVGRYSQVSRSHPFPFPAGFQR